MMGREKVLKVVRSVNKSAIITHILQVYTFGLWTIYKFTTVDSIQAHTCNTENIMPPSFNENKDISVKPPTNNLSERLPKPPLTGRCQCPVDPIIYNITSEPHSLNVCYCHECQRQTGSAFALTLVVPSAGVKMESLKMLLQVRNFERRTESGGIRGGVFCSNCGVRLWHFDPAKPEWTSVKAGTLDQKMEFGAAQHIWTKRMLNGIVLLPKAEAYEEEPDSGPV